MSSVVLIEQRPPFIVMLVSRVPAYTHIIISLFAVLLFQVFPSWTIAKPPVREVTRKRRSASVTSSTSTLVNPDEDVASKKDVDEPGKAKRDHRVSFSSRIPFNKLNSSVKVAISRSKSIKPKLPRRLTLPARRFSTHIVTALQTLTPHHCRPQEGSDSYFSTVEPNDIAVNVTAADSTTAEENSVSLTTSNAAPSEIADSIQTTKVEKVMGDKGVMNQDESHITVESPRKKRTLKKFVRRASMILGDIRLRRRS